MISNNSILTCIDKLHWQYVRMCIVYPTKMGASLIYQTEKIKNQVKSKICATYIFATTVTNLDQFTKQKKIKNQVKSKICATYIFATTVTNLDQFS